LNKTLLFPPGRGEDPAVHHQLWPLADRNPHHNCYLRLWPHTYSGSAFIIHTHRL